MSIAILSTKTGNGHNAVMQTIADEFVRKGYDQVTTFPTFYEDLMFSNKIFSDFYNFLMISSTELCRKFSEFSFLVRPDLSEDFYNGVKDKMRKFIEDNNFRSVISTSHTLNHAFMRVIKENGWENDIDFYIAITDPFEPISVGFAVPGAKRYYCTETVKKILLFNKIPEDSIKVVDYPVNGKFLKNYPPDDIAQIYNDLKFTREKKTILINGGSQGIYHYIKILKQVTTNFEGLQIIFIAGKNESLLNLAKIAAKDEKKNDLRAFGFVNNLEQLMKISDIIISKPGANAFYEAMYMQKPLIIESLNGFLYQEAGVRNFLNKNQVGLILDDIKNVAALIQDMLDDDKYAHFAQNIMNLKLENGAEKIVTDILG